MSLLSFAMDFGAGATASLAQSKAEERKSQLEEQRQANLARLQAQYKREEVDSAVELLRTAQGDDPRAASEARLRLAAMGQLPAPDKGTAAMQEIRAVLVAEGYDPNSPEFNIEFATRLSADREARRGAGQTQVIIPPGERAEQSGLGAGFADRFWSLQARAQQSLRAVPEIERISTALQSGNFETGTAAEQRQWLGRALTFFRVDDSMIPGLRALKLGQPVTADVIEAATEMLAANVLADILQDANFRGSTALMELARNTVPQLSRTVEGNLILTEIMARRVEQDVALATFASEFLEEHGSLQPGEGRPNFLTAEFQFIRNNPIIDEQMRERIRTATDSGTPISSIATGVDKDDDLPIVPIRFGN